MIIVDLVFNLALLVSVSVLSGFIDTRWQRTTTTGMILQGLLFGLVAHLGMSNPFVFAPGVIFDGRSVVLSLCALFFGTYSGMIAGSIALIYRIMLGGPGEIMGVSVILYSTLVGVLCHYLVKSKRFKPTTLFLYTVGLVVHVGMVLLILTLPAAWRSGALKALSLTILGIYPIATALIGKILRDQMDAKEARGRIKKMNADLELLVAERTQELQNALAELTNKNKELEQFTYLSSHDIQEPLRTLSSFTHLLKEDYHSQLGPDGQKYIDFIHDSANRMRELVKGLLDYSFLGKEGVKEVVDCNQVVSDVLQDIEDLIKENNATITVSNLPTVFGYKTELRLLFQNLINNAIKFRNKHVSPVISISCEASAQEICFSIKDNGIGIEEKDREKIFIIFKRMHNRNEYEGTGIGLAHCKKIVELHQGKIWVEANKEAGSIFKFILPILTA